MKQKSRLKTGAMLGVGIISLAFVVFAGFKASEYNSPSRPLLTQQTIAARLAKPAQPQPKATSVKVAATAAKPKDTVTSLPNTGPGTVVGLFLVTTVLATIMHRQYLIRTQANNMF